MLPGGGVDLRDLFRPGGGDSRLTWRRLGVLIDALPGESATKTAIRDALSDDDLDRIADTEPVGHGSWSAVTLRLAALEDAVRQQTWVLIRLLGDPKAKVAPPEPVRRPGVRVRRRRVLTDEGRAYLEHLRANRGVLPPGYEFMAAN